MKEAPHNAADPRKKPGPLAAACVAFAGFGLLIFLPALFFSLGPLITTRGRAWEYEPVRELFIASIVIFILAVVSPLAAAQALSGGRRRPGALVRVAAISSASAGMLFVVAGASMGWAGSVIVIAPCFGLSVYALWWLRRRGAA